jgi:hypothetical protein
LKKYDEETLTIDKRESNKRPRQINYQAFKDAVCAELISDGLQMTETNPFEKL